jgi:5-hydroxyisourate hydrolase-like protein (transthyretin family)
VFSTDKFSLDSSVISTIDSATADDLLSYKIDNPDQVTLLLDFNTVTDAATIDIYGIKADGTTVTNLIGDGADEDIVTNVATGGGGQSDNITLSDTKDTTGRIRVDFKTAGIVSLVISDMNTFYSEAQSLEISPLEAGTTGLLTNEGAVDGYDYGDGNASVTVQAWLENSAATVVDANFASAVETVTFVDPASVSVISEIVRARATGVGVNATDNSTAVTNHLNAAGDKFLTANLRFSRTDINLNQVDLTKWNYGVTSSETTDNITVTSNAITLRPASTAWAVASMDLEVITPAGFSAANYNAYGSLLIRGAVTGDALAANKTYQMIFRHGSDTAPFNDFISPAFTTVTNSVAATAVAVTSAVTSTTDATTGATPSLRAGTKAFTYRAQAKTTGGAADVKTANIPMVAVVTAGAFVPTGESISVSGSSRAITRANQSVTVAGLTNADGRFDVTVTSTTAAALQSYTVTFYIADGGNAGQFVVDGAPRTATYATATATTVTATPAIAASTDVTVKVAVTDQFGTAISTRGTAALNVELKAPTKTNLEQFAAVVNGEATFTFKNYLKTGESDILTARVYTGTSTSPTYVGSLSTNVSLFAPAPVAAINVAPEVTGVVVQYADFITGKTSTAKPGPTDASKTVYTGTVVNANGAGIPGAAVTIAGKGFQFKSGTDFSIDSVTLTTDAAGTFTVDMWTTVASAAGNKLTVTSGDKSASTLVKSAIPTTLSTRNLSFTWNLPTSLAMNTTYAVTAKVTDKWGNGVSGASVKFSGFGAAQFNGAADATRTTDRTGSVTAFLRSLKDVDGPSAIGAELLGTGLTFETNPAEGLAAVYTDATTTAWDESKWSSTIEAQVNFLKTAAAAAKVNVGSFNGKLVVYANGHNGKRISWKVGGRWGSAVATSNTARFDRPTPRRGVTVTVEIYVDGKLELTKSVLTR